MRLDPFRNNSAEATDIETWRAIVRDKVNDIRIEAPGVRGFVGRLSWGDLLGTRFIKIAAQGHVAVNDRDAGAGGGDDFILLSLIEEGRATIRQGGSRIVVGAGDLALYDAGRSYSFSADGPFVQTVLRIERDECTRRLGRLVTSTARRIAGDTCLGRIAARHICEVYGQLDRLRPETERLVQSSLLDIVAGALSEADDNAEHHLGEHQYLMHRRVNDFVEEQLFSSALTCELVACKLGMSQRYLRKLCAASGYNLSARILDRRIEEASKRLTRRAPVRESITRIAYECGFKDAAHFSRAFKTKLGVTPSDFRRLAA